MKTVEEILKEYKIPEECPLYIIKGGSVYDVSWRYLQGGGGCFDDILHSEVMDFGLDQNIGKIVFELAL